MKEEERGEEGKGNRAQEVHEHSVMQQDPGHHQTDQIGREHRLARGLGSQAPEREQDGKDQLHFWLTDSVAEIGDGSPPEPRHHEERRHRDAGK